MKKTLVSALTAALVVGAASTTFAAANPFSDVPSDSWAYDAVSQLAADGVIEGYGDGTFRGQQNITRYEMAQMVAKAMAKSNVSAADKALIDKLAAEFSDELNNLGVRVSNLERNADTVKWNGQARYTYTSNRHDVNPQTQEKSTKDNSDELLLRLEPSAEVNDHWHVNARLDAYTDMSSDNGNFNNGNRSRDDDNDNVKLQRIFAQGDYNNFQVKLGKFGVYNQQDNQLLFDDDDSMSGAEMTFGKVKNGVNVKIGAGRIDLNKDSKFYKNFSDNEINKNDTANIQGIGVNYNRDKFDASASYYHLDTDAFKKQDGNFFNKNYKYSDDGNEDTANIWEIASNYRFDHNWNLGAAFAQNTEADQYDNAWYGQVDYKGAQPENAGTWGMFAGYKRLGANTALDANTDIVGYNQKAWYVGANYAPFHNTLATIAYSNGKDLYNDEDAQNLFGRVQFFF